MKNCSGVECLQGLDIPQDLAPFVNLQKYLSEVKETNYQETLNNIFRLLPSIDIHDILTNAFLIARRNATDTNTIIRLVIDICHIKDYNLAIKMETSIDFDQIAILLYESDVLTPGSRYYFENNRIKRMPNPLIQCIEEDNLKAFVKYLQVNQISPTDCIIQIPHNYNVTSLINVCAFYRAEKCFKNLFLEGSTVDGDTARYAVMGGSLEIIRLCVQKGCNFGPALYEAIYHFRHDIFDWIIQNYDTEHFNIDKICSTNNILFIYFYLSKRTKVYFSNEEIDKIKSNLSSCILRVLHHFNYQIADQSLYWSYLESKSIDFLKLVENRNLILKNPSKALSHAVKNTKNVLSYVIEHGINQYINTPYFYETILEKAVKLDNYDIVEYLLAKGASIYNGNENILLFVKSAPVFKLLLDYNPIIFNTRDSSNIFYNIITFSTYLNTKDDIIECLVKKGININAPFSSGEMPLITAIKHSYRGFCWASHLLKNGANPLIIDKYKRNTLFYACKYSCNEVIEDLIKAGVDPNQKDQNGDRPICYATTLETIKLMIKNGTELDFTWKGYSFISTLYRYAYYDRISLFAQANCDPFVIYKNVPLIIQAVHDKKYQLVKDLSGSNLIENQKYMNDFILSFFDCKEYGPKEFEIFNEYNFINSNLVSIADSKGNTALHYVMLARSNLNMYEKLVHLIIEKGADVNAKNKEGVTPIMNAIKTWNNKTSLLLERSSDINIADNEGRTLLHYAAYYNFLYIEILQNNGNIYIRDNNEMLPYELASRYSNARKVLKPDEVESNADLLDSMETNVSYLCSFIKHLIFKIQ